MKYREILFALLLSTLSLAAVYYYTTKVPQAIKLVEKPVAEIQKPIQHILMYDIVVDSFDIQKGRVKRNQPLYLLLRDYGIGQKEINAIDVLSKDVFDLRKIRSGNPYTAILGRDSLHSLKYLVYEHTALDYIVFQFCDSLNVWNGMKDVDTIHRTFTGSINTSLWNTMIDNGANPMLAVDLSEIYAWTIDFFGLQQGDSIRVIYDELFVDSVSVGIGEVESAWFKHMNTEFWAIPFIQDSVKSFYDEEGNSLRKAFLKAPLRYSRISSRFSNSRYHPILKIRRPHHGVDYAAPVGTPVHAIGDGVVFSKKYNKGAGYMLKIKHNSVYSTAYLHLSRYGKGISNGSYVKQGDIIGYVGSTGLSTGPHLDFRFYKNGSAIDPLKVKAPPVDPVHEENIERYDSVKNVIIKELGSFDN